MQGTSEGGGIGQVEIREANGRSRRTFVAGAGAGILAFAGMHPWQPAPLLNWGVRQGAATAPRQGRTPAGIRGVPTECQQRSSWSEPRGQVGNEPEPGATAEPGKVRWRFETLINYSAGRRADREKTLLCSGGRVEGISTSAANLIRAVLAATI